MHTAAAMATGFLRHCFDSIFVLLSKETKKKCLLFVLLCSRRLKNINDSQIGNTTIMLPSSGYYATTSSGTHHLADKSSNWSSPVDRRCFNGYSFWNQNDFGHVSSSDKPHMSRHQVPPSYSQFVENRRWQQQLPARQEIMSADAFTKWRNTSQDFTVTNPSLSVRCSVEEDLLLSQSSPSRSHHNIGFCSGDTCNSKFIDGSSGVASTDGDCNQVPLSSAQTTDIF